MQGDAGNLPGMFRFDIISHPALRMASAAGSSKITPSQLDADLEKKDDSMVVDWDGPEDHDNPRNWPSRKRWAHVIIISVLALITYVSLYFQFHASIHVVLFYPCLLSHVPLGYYVICENPADAAFSQ
jgi:hypothetical protein